MKSEDIKSFREKGWLKLDNAAKLFPAIMSDSLTSVFRITATLRNPVNYNALREAVEITSKRFPYFSVSLGSGLFWHFLEFNNQMPRIQAEEEIPCTAFAAKRRNEPLYRVVIRGGKISVEFIHILTDGGGAIEYLKSLLYTYLTITGEQITSHGDIILPETPVSEEELEDGYNRFFRKLPPPVRLVKAWHLPFKKDDSPGMKVLRAEVPSQDILEVSRRHNVSVTEYFTAVYMYALHEIFVSWRGNSRKKINRVLRIEVPVNMRKKYPTRTMRNFSLFVLPEIDLRLGTYTFEEILQSVHHQLQISADVKQISRFLSSNVSHEKQFIIRILPLFIKKMAIAAIYRGLASKRWTGIMTNLGVVTLPAEMEEMVNSFDIIPPPPNPKVKVSCGLVSYKNKMRITFCNITSSNEVERLVMTHLAQEGIHVRILDND